MRKILLQYSVLLCLCCIVAAAFGQTAPYDIPGYMGIKAGIDMSTIASVSPNTLARGYTPINGFIGGCTLDLPVYSWLSFAPEIDFQQQGADRNGLQSIANPSTLISGNYAYANFNSTQRLSYINIPLQAKFIWNVSSRFKAYANIGPSVGFLIGAKYTSTGTSDVYSDAQGRYAVVTSQSYDVTENNHHNFHAMSTGLNGALGLSLSFPKGKYFIEYGDNFDMINIQRHTSSIGRNYATAQSFQIGYAIVLHGVHG